MLTKIIIEGMILSYEKYIMFIRISLRNSTIFKKGECTMAQDNKNHHLQVEYIKVIPGGNDTALVLKKNYSSKEKKAINDVILKKDTSIEQVGFVDLAGKPELQMAGGEFCCNATRSAAFYYLNGKPGKLKIIVNGKDVINAGVYDNGYAWCEIPLYHGDDVIIEKEPGIYQVRMNGMVSVVIQPEKARLYLEDKTKLKTIAMEFIDQYDLRSNEAVGIMFLERDQKIKLHPVVWVRDINTLYYETGCGSGTTATAMVEAFLKKENQKLEVIQPSGLAITAEITIENQNVVKAVISGEVNTDNNVVKVDVLEDDMEG
jgi:diaminopimelate epimerase